MHDDALRLEFLATASHELRELQRPAYKSETAGDGPYVRTGVSTYIGVQMTRTTIRLEGRSCQPEKNTFKSPPIERPAISSALHLPYSSLVSPEAKHSAPGGGKP